MGFLDKLKEIGAGVADIFAAPLGILWDGARAIPDSNYNPGLFGVLGNATDRFATGVAKITEGSGLGNVGSALAQHTPVDEVVGGILNQMQLIYSTEYQKQTNQSPLGLQHFGVTPGTASLQRGGAFVTGMASAALPGGTPIGDVGGVWQHSMESTPGQALLDNLPGVDYWNKSEAEKKAIRASTWYNLISGTSDAVFSWYIDPGVLAGKGIKAARSRLILDAGKVAERANEAYKAQGIEFKAGESANGVVNLQATTEPGSAVYHVTRSSNLEAIKREGLLRIPEDADVAFKHDVNRTAIQKWIADRFGKFSPDPQRDQLTVQNAGDDILARTQYLQNTAEQGWVPPTPLQPDMYYTPEGAFEFYSARGQFESYARTVKGLDGAAMETARDAMLRHEIFGSGGTSLFSDADIAQWVQDAWDHYDSGTVSGGLEMSTLDNAKYAIDMAELGGAPPEILRMTSRDLSAIVDDVANTHIANSIAGSGVRGTNPNRPQPSPAYRGLYLLGEGELDEAKRYAAALYADNPNDPPVLLKIEANGLPVMFEDYGNPMLQDRRSGLPNDASLVTMADQIPPDGITEVHRYLPNELDPVFSGDAKTIADYLEPGGRMHPNLYNPDGTVISPEHLVNPDEMALTLATGGRLWSESPLMAQKFLEDRSRLKALNALPEGLDPLNRAMGHKSVQQALNWMDGKTASEIRRTVFPDNPHGAVLSDILASAGNYQERRAILAAAMGIRLPGETYLPEMLQTRLKMLTEGFDRLQKGLPMDDKFVLMASDIDPLELATANPEAMTAMVKEAIDATRKALDTETYKSRISRAGGILDQVPKVTKRRQLGALIRRTDWYSDGVLGKPIRSVVEMRPHQFLSVKDPESDIQLIRQLTEAAPVGITEAQVNQYHNKYLGARTDQERLAIVLQAENEIIEAAAKHAGMSVDEIDALLNEARNGRRSVQEFLKSSRYGPNDVVTWVDKDTGEVIRMAMPLLPTQIESWVPIADVREIIKVSSNIRRIRAKAIKPVAEVMNQFNQIWKPTVLLRGGWPLRVVTDEQLRILAKSGSLLKHMAAIGEMDNVPFTSIFSKGLSGPQRAAATFGTVALTQPLTAISQRVARAIARGAEKLHLLDPQYMEDLRKAGIDNLASARASFGGASEGVLHEMSTLLGRDEATILDHLLKKGTGQWRSITPESREYGAGWLRVLNDQIGRDPLSKSIIEGYLNALGGGRSIDVAGEAALEAGKRFLRSEEGRQIAERMPWRSANPDKWVEEVFNMIGHYTGDMDPKLIRNLLNRKLKKADIEALDEAIRPDTVHAEIVAQTLGTSEVSRYINEFMSSSFDIMGRLPTDTLSRQPFFKQVYADEMRNARAIARKQGVTFLDEADIRLMDQKARATALHEVRKYLYDLAETSRFGHLMRFMMPFYPAWQEVIQVWGGLALHDPSIVARARLLWNAPDKAGFTVHDDQGNAYLQFRLGEGAQKLLTKLGWDPYQAKYLGEGGIRLGKDSFNLVLNSPLPSVGPLIQMPFNEVVKNKPELESALKWILPYGVKANTAEILLSPLARQFKSDLEGENSDSAYARSFVNAVTWMDVMYRSGEITTPPSLQEAHNIAKKLHVLRFWARLASPAQPIFDSPLQPYMDTYRTLVEQYGTDKADEIFLNQYGQEFFAVTMSRSVSQTGLPPTVEAETARRQYESLIQAHPEYGRLIVGDKAVGEFSTAAYAAQLTRPSDNNPSTKGTERSYREVEIDPRTGGIIDVDRRLGWQEYIQAMDLIDLERQKRGLPNLRVSEAQDLAQLKSQITAGIAQKYPSWYEDFSTRDDLKWQKRVDAFNDISKSPLMQDRPDIEGVKEYIRVRNMVIQELNRRGQLGGSKTLGAASNADLAELWQSVVGGILSQYPAFVPVYYRYLEGDPVK